ncbi:serine hydrolase [Cytobacillus firmus]|uniref:serine hydrolase n=1 Tax=Cytobacillus firmus TaxID=1399 RepID=UPI0018CE9A60|nr:serine hydrolase [Cytobacillus firmus]MDD9310177.1 serine hydrolase [Cytobacillus firmus]MED1942927.1 serine hydrolase [Cytobacillus firmus]
MKKSACFLLAFMLFFQSMGAFEAKAAGTLDSYVKPSIKAYPNISIYYENLVTREAYSYNASKIRPAASTIKLPLALFVYNLASKGKINLSEKLTYRSHHYYGGSGVIQKDRVGTSYTIRDLLKKCIVYSDNIAFIMLREKVGKSNFINYAKSLGGKTVYPAGMNVTTANDLSVYLKHVWNFAEKNPQYGNELLNLLANTVYKETIAPGLASKNVAHKVGYIPKDLIYNDAAIIMGDQPYILVIMTTGIPVKKDVKFISSLAGKVHTYHINSSVNLFLKHLADAERASSELYRQIYVDYEGKATVKPYAAYNQTGNSLIQAKKAYAALSETHKKAYSPKLKNIELTRERAMNFIDGITAGEKLTMKQQELESYKKAGDLDKMEASYHSLSSLIKRQAQYLYKVHGKTTRDAVLKQYKDPSEKTLEETRMAVTLNMILDQIKEDLTAQNQSGAEKGKLYFESNLPKVSDPVVINALQKKYNQLNVQ